jgi:hypothetical protein
MRLQSRLTIAISLLIVSNFFVNPGIAQQRPQQWSAPIVSWIASAESYLGKPLHATAINENNRNRFILHLLSLNEARFAFGAQRGEPGETFDVLRRRASISWQLSTCEGRTGGDAGIFRVIIYQKISDELEPKMPTILKDMLERANTPLALTSPTALRASGLANSNGLAFEYTKDARVAIVGLFNDNGDDGQGYLVWLIADTSVCR